MSNSKDPFIEVPAGTAVYRQGEPGTDMYIIESGQVDLVLQVGGEVLDALGPGDFFGEAELLEDQVRQVTAVAKAASRLLRIERAALAGVLGQNAEIAVRMMRKMAARQRRTDQRLQDLLSDQGKARAAAAQRAAAPAAAVQVPVAAPAPAPVAEAVPAPKPAREPPPPPPEVRPAPAAPVAAPTLVLRHASGQALPLDAARSEFLIGRPDPVTGTTPDLDLGAFDANRTLSRRHAKILREGALYFVRDEGGANGTFVNGERMNTGASIALKPGDKLRFGSVEVELATA
ncbi:MAG: cyclic nucleotide-binding domain-containing protein [Rudaea sp.]|nr:cyclic nucleotide-binding domain-containing protein [Rudaea sp.]